MIVLTFCWKANSFLFRLWMCWQCLHWLWTWCVHYSSGRRFLLIRMLSMNWIKNCLIKAWWKVHVFRCLSFQHYTSVIFKGTILAGAVFLGLFWLNDLGQVRNCRKKLVVFLMICKSGLLGPYFFQSSPILEFNRPQWSYASV